MQSSPEWTGLCKAAESGHLQLEEASESHEGGKEPARIGTPDGKRVVGRFILATSRSTAFPEPFHQARLLRGLGTYASAQHHRPARREREILEPHVRRSARNVENGRG